MPKLLCSPDAPEWLELRRSGITASDLPVIMGLVSWDSPWALYHRKCGLLPEQEQSDRMRLGSWLEDAIHDEWAKATGLTGSVQDGGLFVSDERPWQMATPDALVVKGGFDVTKAVLECKTSATRDGWGWGDDPTCSCSSEEAKNLIPAYVRAQVLWQMDTLGVARGHVAVVFLPSGEFRSYTIEHAPDCPSFGKGAADGDPGCDVCLDTLFMRAKALEFYRRITGDLPAPPVDHLTVTTKALQDVYAGFDGRRTAELDLADVTEWLTAREALKAAQRDERHATNKIREALGKAGTGTVKGVPVVRRQVVKRAGYEVAPGVQDKLTKIKEE